MPPPPAPPSSPPPPPCKLLNELDTSLNFQGATVTRSNLGGLGPDSSQHPSILYSNIATDTITGLSVDLQVSNISSYNPVNTGNNGLAGLFGQINLYAPQEADGAPNEVTLAFTFLDTASGAPITLGRVRMALFDFDEGSYGNGRECISILNARRIQLSGSTELQELANPTPSEEGETWTCESWPRRTERRAQTRPLDISHDVHARAHHQLTPASCTCHRFVRQPVRHQH